MVFTDDNDDFVEQWWEEEESDDDDLTAAVLILADAEERERKKARRGSVPGRQVGPRDMRAGNLRIVADYFADPPVYSDKFFRRRFRMSKSLFLRIVEGVETHDDYFRQRTNAVGLLGATALQKVVGSFRMLAYDVPADSMDEVVRIAKSTMIEAFHHFVKAVVEVFGEQYLRPPTTEDTARLMEINNKRGWPGMLGCIDCMHWMWKNCPTA